MNLSRKIAFIGIVASSLACHDSAAPPVPPVGYTLVNVSGRPVPTFVFPIPEAPTIISAVMQLDASGRATLTENRRELNGGIVPYTSRYTYNITGNAIQFDYDPPCPPNALCAGPPKGTISGSDLSLVMYGENTIVFNFRHFVPD